MNDTPTPLEPCRWKERAHQWRQAHAALWESVIHAEKVMDAHGVPTSGRGILTWWYRVELACKGKPWPDGYQCLMAPGEREKYEWKYDNKPQDPWDSTCAPKPTPADLPPLSKEARDARRPVPPGIALDTLHGAVHEKPTPAKPTPAEPMRRLAEVLRYVHFWKKAYENAEAGVPGVTVPKPQVALGHILEEAVNGGAQAEPTPAREYCDEIDPPIAGWKPTPARERFANVIEEMEQSAQTCDSAGHQCGSILRYYIDRLRAMLGEGT